MAEGLTPTEFAQALRRLDNPRGWTNELRKEYRKVGTQAAKWSRTELAGMSPRLARAARGVRGASSATSASVSVSSRGGALAAVWGMKRERVGWYAKPQYAGGPRNTLPWVGNSWTVATAGEGPRGINSALARHQSDLEQQFLDAAMGVAARAFHAQ